MRRVGWAVALAATAALASTSGAAADAKRKAPYFASITAGKARMRTGPGRTYPASWLYVRADLPVKVIDSYKAWRKIEDPDGTQGWMLGALLSEARTGIVRDAIAELLERPAAGARVAWRAEPGVVGRLSQCASGWCRFDVRGQAGYVEAARLWGVDPNETLP